MIFKALTRKNPKKPKPVRVNPIFGFKLQTLVYTHIQDPTRFYTRVFDAPFIAHKVTVKCVFMKTYVLESFDNCMIVCKT